MKTIYIYCKLSNVTNDYIDLHTVKNFLSNLNVPGMR